MLRNLFRCKNTARGSACVNIAKLASQPDACAGAHLFHSKKPAFLNELTAAAVVAATAVVAAAAIVAVAKQHDQDQDDPEDVVAAVVVIAEHIRNPFSVRKDLLSG